MNPSAGAVRLWMLGIGVALLGGGAGTLRATTPSQDSAAPPALGRRYRSPFAVAVSPDGKTLYVTDATAAAVVVFDVESGGVRAEIPLRGSPRGMALSPDGSRLYVAERGAGSVAVVDPGAGRVEDRLETDRWPVAVAVAPRSRRLYVCNEDTSSVTVFALEGRTARKLRKAPAVREPCAVAVAPDERTVVVANRIPAGRSTDPAVAAAVSVFEADAPEPAHAVPLPPGSSIVHGIAVGPEGRWAYAAHGLGRFRLPMTQLERGWVNTFALSILDLGARRRIATVLLDAPTRGAADPFSVVCAPDGKRLWISHAGVHEVSRLEIAFVHELLEGNLPPWLASRRDAAGPNGWVRLRQDPRARDELANDLAALTVARAIARFDSGGKVPRGLALSPDGRSLFVANYFSGSVAVLDAQDGRVRRVLSLGEGPEPDAARRGELLFHDATAAFQAWHSCATCHPDEARQDGLRWDFVEDGLGNAMNTLSLRYVDRTGPLHRRGTLKDVRQVAEHGLKFTHGIVPTERQVEDLVAYLSSLTAEPSPYLAPGGSLSQAARRGKILFEGKADCARCHRGPYFTDGQFWDVGIADEGTKGVLYKTPSLIEAYRTAPYLHDGRALTLEEVLTSFNPEDRHGKTRGLTGSEIADLVAYLLSL